VYLFKKVVFNCKRATFLSVKKEENGITFFEQLELSYHLLYCDPCRNFIEQSKRLREIGNELRNKMQSVPPFSLSAEARERISKEISKEM